MGGFQSLARIAFAILSLALLFAFPTNHHRQRPGSPRAFGCCECNGGSRGRRAPAANTPPFPPVRPTAAPKWVGASPAGGDELGGDQLGGAGEEGAGEVLGVSWRLWEWMLILRRF